MKLANAKRPDREEERQIELSERLLNIVANLSGYSSTHCVIESRDEPSRSNHEIGNSGDTVNATCKRNMIWRNVGRDNKIIRAIHRETRPFPREGGRSPKVVDTGAGINIIKKWNLHLTKKSISVTAQSLSKAQ